MKRNALTLVVGVILLAIFFLLLFTFQVRQTEMVVVTTFDRPSEKPIDEPGLYFKWPFPIQNVYRFDKRVHTFEDAFEQMLTRDGNNILANVFVGWSIDDPIAFFNSFPQGGTDAEERAEAAEPALKSIVRKDNGDNWREYRHGYWCAMQEPLDAERLAVVAREYVGADGRISLDDLDAIAAEYNR